MTKQEFEILTIRGEGHINNYLYDVIERYYMSENDYHKYNNPEGIEESKENFCKRVFGKKVNTPKTICEKLIKESIKENRWALRGNESATKDRLDHMDTLIREHYEVISKWN
jgi:hypothetical protein